MYIYIFQEDVLFINKNRHTKETYTKGPTQKTNTGELVATPWSPGDQKRPTKETYKRDLQKRPATETYERDLQKRLTKKTYKRNLQRNLQKRPTKETYKRDLQKTTPKNVLHGKTSMYMRKETCIYTET